MRLYYDKTTNEFSLKQTASNELVFEAHENENYKGTIECGSFKIRINTYFCPQKPEKEYIRVNIFLSDIQLLPISKSIKRTSSGLRFEKKRINTFSYPNIIPGPNTCAYRDMYFDWYFVLKDICDICNGFDEWLLNEARELINLLSEDKLNLAWGLSYILQLTTPYEPFVPAIKTFIHPIADKHCLIALQDGINHLKEWKEKEVEGQSYNYYLNHCKIIWKYIQDNWIDGNNSKSDL